MIQGTQGPRVTQSAPVRTVPTSQASANSDVGVVSEAPRATSAQETLVSLSDLGSVVSESVSSPDRPPSLATVGHEDRQRQDRDRGIHAQIQEIRARLNPLQPQPDSPQQPPLPSPTVLDTTKPTSPDGLPAPVRELAVPEPVIAQSEAVPVIESPTPPDLLDVLAGQGVTSANAQDRFNDILTAVANQPSVTPTLVKPPAPVVQPVLEERAATPPVPAHETEPAPTNPVSVETELVQQSQTAATEDAG